MSQNVSGKLPTDAEWRTHVEQSLELKMSDAHWAEILAAYPIQDYAGNGGARLSAMATDAGFDGPHGRSVHIGECGTLRAARDMARAGASIWMYRMERLGS